jgi:hypothetical protein
MHSTVLPPGEDLMEDTQRAKRQVVVVADCRRGWNFERIMSWDKIFEQSRIILQLSNWLWLACVHSSRLSTQDRRKCNWRRVRTRNTRHQHKHQHHSQMEDQDAIYWPSRRRLVVLRRPWSSPIDDLKEGNGVIIELVLSANNLTHTLYLPH